VTPGYHVMPAEKYHADCCVVPSLSNSIAHVLLTESPRKAWFKHPRLNPDYREEHDSKFDLGTCAHAVLLEKDPASQVVIVNADDWRTKAAKEERDAARAAGKTPLLERHFKEVMAMVKAADAFIRQSEIADYWQDADSELTGIALEEGVWLRSRFDRITKNRRLIFDYKTCMDVSPEGFARQIVRMGFHIQESFYRRVARALGAIGPRFVFLAQSVEPPHECALHGCAPSMQQIADDEVERAIKTWRGCLQSKDWPSYGGRIHWASPTTWQIQEAEMRSFEEQEVA
jgi:hypothetical protein